MLSSGFASAPITKFLVFYAVTSAVLVSATDTKHYFGFSIDHHILRYAQWWRLMTWPTCYTNSTEVLFAAFTLYQLRVIERLWGTRKLASFLLTTLPYTLALPPLILFLLRSITPYTTLFTYLPSGPTALIFALLSQYQSAIPYTYRYKLSASENTGVLLTSKSASYLLPLQLALSQLPGSAVVALVGWVLGLAWRMEVLPGARWRVPGWVVGQGGKRGGDVEGLRRRMEREGVGMGTGAEIEGAEEDGGVRRR